MSGEVNPTQASAPDPRDLKIAELTDQVKNLEEKLAKLEALLASLAEMRSSKTPVFTENYSFDRNPTSEKKPKKETENGVRTEKDKSTPHSIAGGATLMTEPS